MLIAIIIIHKSSDVHGLTVNRKLIKLCQLADDMGLFLTDMISVKIFTASLLLEEFSRYAGRKLNKDNTKAIIIYKDGTLFGIKWFNKTFQNLGLFEL